MLRKRESAAEEECSRLVSETREKSGAGRRGWRGEGRKGGRAGIALKGSVTGGGGKGVVVALTLSRSANNAPYRRP